MAVPKKKKSKSKTGLRKGGNDAYNTTFPEVVKDSRGEHVLSHQVSKDGYYKGRKVIDVAKKKASEEAE